MILEQIEAQERYYQKTISQLQDEVKYWKERYWQEIYGIIKHNDEMYVNVLKALIERNP